MSEVDGIMAIGLAIFCLALVAALLLFLLIREYLYFKNYAGRLEARCQKLEQVVAEKEKSLSDALSSNNERFNYLNAIFTTMKDGILVFRDTGDPILMNPAAFSYLNVDKQVFFQPSQPGKAPCWQPPSACGGIFYRQVLSACQKVYEKKENLEFEWKDQDRWFQVSALLIPDRYQDQAYLGVLALVIDITQSKRIETLRKEFVSNVSHEFRTPMTLISGYAQMLRLWDQVTLEERVKALDVIEWETKRLKKLVSELLVLSQVDRMEEQEEQPFVDMEGVVDGILWTMEAMAKEKGVELIQQVKVDYPILRANEQFFYQMMMNLIDNGIKYNHEGGWVKVQVENNQSKVFITVSDSGPGILPEHQQRIFERFYRIDEDRNSRSGGHGIGLSIVSSIVHGMKGTIWVESKPGQGAVFRIQLPVG